MNNWTATPQFEENIRRAFNVPDARPEFVNTLEREIARRAQSPQRSARSLRSLRPAYRLALLLLTLLTAAVIAIGPQRVYAAVVRLFGYIPGVGIVDDSSPIRVLAEPVSVTRDGITITVSSATLTGDQTHIDYRIFGVPGSAYPRSESEPGCMQREYLRLADGTQLAQISFGYEPIPADVNEAVFVIPCIGNTLPGVLPENWELPLRFVPAPPDLTVMPVYEENTPSPQSALPPGSTPVQADDFVKVSKVIETEDGYILIGQFQPNTQIGGWVQTSALELTDAAGTNVSFTYPQDVNEAVNQQQPLAGWAIQFKAAGLVYPLTIRFNGVELIPTDSNSTAEFTFNTGPRPQPGQEWLLDQDIRLDGHTLKILSITADSRGGYSFRFQVDPQVYSTAIEIVGYTPNGGGGGGGGGLTDGKFYVSLNYPELPTGELTVRLSDLTLIGEPLSWQNQWSPSTPRDDLPANPTAQPGLCLTMDSLAQAAPIPADLAGGKAIFYEALPDSDDWGLVQYNLDGTQPQVLVPNASGAVFSSDGSRLAYASEDGIHILDLGSGEERVLPLDTGGFDLHWSPDGSRIAYIALSNTIIDSAFMLNVNSGTAQQVSEWSYETIVGWSPDGRQLYYAAPYTGGAAWIVYRYDLDDGQTQELFTIENGTAKALEPRISPDGQWIAYRGRDNSSIYLARPDGSEMHLAVENANANGLAWTASGWLGVSLHDYQSKETTLVLIDPQSCTVYRTDGLTGQLKDIFLP
ncbi:MAG: hypothetical protein PWQ55_845 [Chloroflexota bacterium]|nr:hypothetical protein [Chloroflexota bacterium]